MVTLLFLMPLFQYTPNVVLGAIIVTAVVGLIDIPAAYSIWKIDKFDFVVTLCAFLGVIFISVQQGLAIAVSNYCRIGLAGCVDNIWVRFLGNEGFLKVS